MSASYYLNVTVHVLAALLWLGGMFFLAAVGAPVLRRIEPAALRVEVFRRLGERFRNLGWGAIAVLVATGIGNLHFRGVLRAELWSDPHFWSTAYGTALAWKLASVGAMIAVSALHDFVFGPVATRVDPDGAAGRRLRRTAALLARANALLGVVVVIAAVRLARGG